MTHSVSSSTNLGITRLRVILGGVVIEETCEGDGGLRIGIIASNLDDIDTKDRITVAAQSKANQRMRELSSIESEALFWATLSFGLTQRLDARLDARLFCCHEVALSRHKRIALPSRLRGNPSNQTRALNAR